MKSIPDNFLSAATSDPVLTRVCDEIIERLQAGDAVDMASLALEHPEHADQLRRLLPALEALVDFGASSAAHPLGVVPKQIGSALAPRVLGDYRILREIGRGGMGVVYEAEQRSLNRRVALKVLPMAAALDARQFQRFQLEAQAAACLHHNNIVPVFAVGTEGGVPFYAMQYIEGRSLADVIHELRRAEGLDREPVAPKPDVMPRLADFSTTALARSLVSGPAEAPKADAPTEDVSEAGCALPPGEGARRAGECLLLGAGRPTKTASSTRTRDYCRNVAGLGLQAAEALDHSHTRGILHRDIKPANLLLDAEGRLWVTDFGLAQIQGNHGLTLSGDILGTLRYMSPEQALARRVVIDGRTDVYSLGVTLYELLTLQPAFDGKDRAEILRKIGEDDPTPLRTLNASAPQDLETIIHKALAKEPSERYATARELADDLRYHLENRPIRARRPNLLDRAAKWGRRHSTSVAAAGVILILAMIGLATSTILIAREQRRTAAALTQADVRYQFARKAVDEMYTEVAEKWLAQQPKLSQVQRDFLEKALAFYEQFSEQSVNDPQAQFDAARARCRVGVIKLKLGKHDLAEAAFRRSIRQLQNLADHFPDRTEYLSEVAFVSIDLGGQALHLGRFEEAETIFKRSTTIFESLVVQHPKNREGRARFANSLLALGSLREQQARYQEAEPLLRRSLDLFAELRVEAELRPIFRGKPAQCEGGLGHVYLGTERFQEAEKAFLRAIQQLESLLAEEPANPDYRHQLVIDLINLALAQHIIHRSEEAFANDRRSMAMMETLAKDFPDINYDDLLLKCQIDVFISANAAGLYNEAEQVGRRCIDLGEKLFHENPAEPKYRDSLSAILSMLADLHSGSPPGGPLHKPARAVELARRAAELKAGHDLSKQSLGWALYRTGDLRGCIEVLTEREFMHCAFLAMAHWRLGDKDRARACYATADIGLEGYEKRWNTGVYPTPLMLRKFRSEAAALLGVQPPEGLAKPTPAADPIRPPK
jgi:eukaryotic-like serine/threonine-protein kinase